MSEPPPGLVTFDLLCTTGPASGSTELPPLPDPRHQARCRAWFASRGAECFVTTFGLSCRMPRRDARVLFGTEPDPGVDLPVPSDLSDLVEQITVSMSPELFA